MNYKLSDEVLAAVAQSVQLAILTGTDVVDHLRLIEVEPDPSDVMPSVDQTHQVLTLTADCRDRLQRNIDDLLERAKQLSAAMKLTSAEA